MSEPANQNTRLNLLTEEIVLPPPPHVPVDLIEQAVRWTKISFIVMVIGLVALSVVCGPMLAAKLVVCCLLFGLGLVFLAVIYYRNVILFYLLKAEELGELACQEALVQMHEARLELRQLDERIQSTVHPTTDHSLMAELMKNAMPAINLIVKREKSILSWTMFGAKVAKSVFDAFKKGG